MREARSTAAAAAAAVRTHARTHARIRPGCRVYTAGDVLALDRILAHRPPGLLLKDIAPMLAAGTDALSPAVADLARRWMAMAEQFTGDDEAVHGKVSDV